MSTRRNSLYLFLDNIKDCCDHDRSCSPSDLGSCKSDRSVVGTDPEPENNGSGDDLPKTYERDSWEALLRSREPFRPPHHPTRMNYSSGLIDWSKISVKDAIDLERQHDRRKSVVVQDPYVEMRRDTLTKHRDSIESRETESDAGSAMAATRARDRIRSLTGSDKVAINDWNYLQKLSIKLDKEQEADMDRREEELAEEERQRMRRLMKEGLISVNDLQEDRMLFKEYKHQKRRKNKLYGWTGNAGEFTTGNKVPNSNGRKKRSSHKHRSTSGRGDVNRDRSKSATYPSSTREEFGDCSYRKEVHSAVEGERERVFSSRAGRRRMYTDFRTDIGLSPSERSDTCLGGTGRDRIIKQLKDAESLDGLYKTADAILGKKRANRRLTEPDI